jgi:hypothetical protein
VEEQTGTPTPTPYSGDAGVDLRLNAAVFYEDMRFLLEIDYLNPSSQDIPADAYIVLDVYGSYWFWPGWEASIDRADRTMPRQAKLTETIFDFIWPVYDGNFSDIKLWAAALRRGTSDLIGNYDVVSFGCNQ